MYGSFYITGLSCDILAQQNLRWHHWNLMFSVVRFRWPKQPTKLTGLDPWCSVSGFSKASNTPPASCHSSWEGESGRGSAWRNQGQHKLWRENSCVIRLAVRFSVQRPLIFEWHRYPYLRFISKNGCKIFFWRWSAGPLKVGVRARPRPRPCWTPPKTATAGQTG